MSEDQKRAVITGAGAGLGRELAMGFAARGVAVALVDRDAAGIEATRLGLPASARSLSIAQDLTADGAAEAVIGRIEAEWGGLDVLVNNAGFGAIEPFFEMSAALWQKTLAINVTALAMMTKVAALVLKRQGGGRIVNITSPGSRMALPNYAAYAASKAGVDSITRSSAIALAPFGITVNSVAPGMMDTEMQRSTERDLARAEGREDFDAFIAERTRRAPLGRRARIDEVAATVLWLALDAPDYITAERLNASGGMDRD
ncbi:short-chain dehydrogenase [Kaistia algarum]|uniref:SDR family NAD(P)-dependent oxidoreductase n=1 Tax=Kaistia algarum TaxID=2083279 RepID=UPI000CE816E3|nr:SDR family oxidoreductase [Kaistia algarum]MCX5514252.1 SDR family NAD(P)-dependent oxidoreductase [Kaistia algarum]PPE77361.1 short-chain dehydrogenase [Kaistia algarum]